ncbi:hypothetical protein [Corynebacterium dentalis]|uniref:hypothetical protein n=1 Tax=Corynebacterium dentalis TaxID=2014528 RepID=UPI0028A15BE5|nr:hypothetical protein [Corynebacterium dentalis]
MIQLDGKKITGVYHGGVKIKEAYFGSQKVFTAYPKLTFEDQFNSTTKAAWWTENTGILFNGSHISCSNNRKATATEYLSTSADVVEQDRWRIDIKVYDLPDPVQESSVVIGTDRDNGYIASFAPNRMWIGRRKEGKDTIVSSTTTTKLTSSTQITFARTSSGFTLSTSDGVTLSMSDDRQIQGAGNRRMGIIQSVFRGGTFNNNYYYSPGINWVTATTTN